MMKNKIIATLLTAATLGSCTQNTTKNTPQNGEQCVLPDVPAVILDTDLGSSADDLFAMTMLYDAHRKGSVNLQAIMVNRDGIANLRVADIMNTYYGFDGLSIGKVHDAPQNTQIFIPYWQLAMPEDYPDTPKFKRTLSDAQLSQLPYAETLYRQILADAPDTSVVIFSVGFATNIGHLLVSKPDTISDLDGVSLVSKKVKALYIQGGHLSNYGDEPEYNLRLDPENALILINKWPRPIYFSPGETGERFDYVPENVTADQKANNLTDSPINYVYTHFDCNTGQKMWDACAVLQYLHPEFFELHGPVRYAIDNDMILHEQPGTSHYMTFTKTAQQDSVIMSYIRTSSTGGLSKQ